MNSQSKFRLFLVIFIALLVLGGGGLFAVYRFLPATRLDNQSNLNTQNANQGNQVVNNSNGAVSNINTGVDTNTVPSVNTSLSEPASDESRVRSLAQSFTERYGSYSNQNEYENLTRLYTYMSAKLQRQTQNYIEAQGVQNTTTYTGVTTTVVSVAVEQLEGDKATLLVTTRRRESTLGQAATTSSQQARLLMVKVEGKWLVDKFDWQ